MRKPYIKPDTQIVTISMTNPLLQGGEDPGIFGGAKSNDKVGTSMDSNSSSFDDGEDWCTSSRKSLWDD